MKKVKSVSNNVIKKIVALFFLFFLVFNARGGNMPISSGSMHHIPSDQMKLVKEKAISGDTKSIKKLYNYYTFTEYDELKSINWLKKLAESGDPIAQYNYASHLLASGALDTATIWARKSFENDHPEAKQLLLEIQEHER